MPQRTVSVSRMRRSVLCAILEKEEEEIVRTWAEPSPTEDRDAAVEQEVMLRLDDVVVPGALALPDRAVGIVAFAHGSGSGRSSPRNRLVASILHEARLGTLLFDLLTVEESLDRSNVFDIPLLAGRLAGATEWLGHGPATAQLPLGYFGASTGAAAALVAAAMRPQLVRAVVSRGGRPDLAGASLGRVTAPTLLIVGSRDTEVVELNQLARHALTHSPVTLLQLVPGATHLFEESGTLELVGDLACNWFEHFLGGPGMALVAQAKASG
jgi:putative phosphoribosyl transferase